MKAGRELDAMVAEKVMGWTPRGDHPLFGTPVFATGRADTLLPKFSTDIEAAWRVVEKIQDGEPGWRLGLLGGDRQDGREFGWHAEFFGHVDPSQNYGQRHGQSYADTAPLAICLAALKAVGVEIP